MEHFIAASSSPVRRTAPSQRSVSWNIAKHGDSRLNRVSISGGMIGVLLKYVRRVGQRVVDNINSFFHARGTFTRGTVLRNGFPWQLYCRSPIFIVTVRFTIHLGDSCVQVALDSPKSIELFANLSHLGCTAGDVDPSVPRKKDFGTTVAPISRSDSPFCTNSLGREIGRVGTV